MQITTASAGLADVLAPAAAPSEPRPSESTTAESTAAAFDAMLAALVGPSVASNQPTPVTSETEEVVDGETPESDDAASTDAATGIEGALGADAPTMETLHYGLRTDAQLTTPRAETAGEPASEQGKAAHARRDARHQLSGHGRGSAAHDAARQARLAAKQTPDTASDDVAIEDVADDASDVTTAVAADAAAETIARFDTNGMTRAARTERTERAAPVPVASDAARAHANAHSRVARTTTETAAPETTAPASTAPASTTSTAPSRDVAALAPELQTRLERVMDRMRDEFGYDVEVVETQRSQARQDALFAQGRTQPGEVVTWTRSSRHLTGDAVDVKIDGGWDDAAAFRTLQRVAKEEGLKTLGPRDAGHLELPRHLAKEIIAAEVDVTAPATDAAPIALPKPAAAPKQAALPSHVVAPVAEVASVAQVARVAEVAAVAAPAIVANANANADAATDAKPGVRTARGPRAGVPAATRATRNDEKGERGEGAPGQQVAAGTPASQHAPRFAATGAPVLGAAAVDRVTRVTDRIEAAAADRGVSHLTLRVDNALGGEDHIRIDVRGLTVDTQIALGDAAAAERLGNNIGELRQALERQGLTADTVRISSAGAKAAEAANAAPVDAGRVAASSGVTAGTNAGDAGSARDGSSQSQHQQSRESMHRDASSSSQQHGSRDHRRGHDAEPWLADEFTPRGHAYGRARNGR
ncbi:flagellar hook-length control protein FliK [Roseisolibacter agri]|uniref:Flagellar hook-length control protein-like C-terminal domain-containing protein n=1 Tax=Roseisolibacter agri TaxID=2014610 RepID=A0AA37QEN0_9BACT|nr:flagellar hook-length control protein FliK [Roseisolibacter agri]GLC25368.1 hypothetical protein rosag_18810 [Roseisolibacter agri]